MPITREQLLAIKYSNEKRILNVNPKVPRSSGIYILTREENEFKFSYVGQSVNLLERLGSHLSGYEQHIDLSLKAHGLYSDENPTGWKVSFITFPVSELDDREREYILKSHKAGYQFLNVYAGGQDSGKTELIKRSVKGYRKGIEQGYKKASKEISNLFEKHLNYTQKSDKPNKNQAKASAKFKAFLDYHTIEEEENG